MSDEDDWKQRAIQHDMAVFGARARRAGAEERQYVDEKGRVRLVEHIGKTNVVKTVLTEEGRISYVSVTSVKAELRAINRQWDEMAPRITPEMLVKFVAIMNAEGSTPRQKNAARIALGHIWRRRKDLGAAGTRSTLSSDRYRGHRAREEAKLRRKWPQRGGTERNGPDRQTAGHRVDL